VSQQVIGDGLEPLPRVLRLLLASYLNNLALILRDLGNPAPARPLMERASAIAEAAYGPDRHPSVATHLSNLTMIVRELGDPVSAWLLAERALAITEVASGPDHTPWHGRCRIWGIRQRPAVRGRER
jgi:hypothetical protein